MNNYITGDKSRLFINSRIGCNSKCTYCYLKFLKLEDTECKSANEIISMLEKNENFIEGKNGTIISLGCYSECWDNTNKGETIDIIKYFLSKGNPVQMATKQKIEIHELSCIKEFILWKNQFSVFVSIPTMSYHHIFEKQTALIEDRITNFEIAEYLGIPIILYIKPVLENITIRDIEKYLELIKKYSIKDVVVGSLFQINSECKDFAPVGNGKLYYSNKNMDEKKIIEKLKHYCNVYRKSSDYIVDKVKETEGV